MVPIIGFAQYKVTSGDETDHGVKTILGAVSVQHLLWRSAEFVVFLHNAEDISTLNRYDQTTGSRGRGATSRIRFIRNKPPATKLRRGSYPVDFPINCYDKDWLDSLPPLVRKEMEKTMKPPVDLTFPAELLK